jgi:hypothetical protein
MNHWVSSHDLRERAWAFLECTVQADIALVQEAIPTGRGKAVVFREGGIHDERVDPPRDLEWGSGVVSYGPAIRVVDHAWARSDAAVPLLRSFPGTVAIADVAGLVAISAYGVIDRGYADTTVHRILSDLTPLIDERKGRGIMLGGDLNITTQWSVKHGGIHEEWLRRDRNLFERFEALRLHNLVVRSVPGPLPGCDCSGGDECRHVQTQRHEKSTFPWQNDYIFVSGDLLDRVARVDVLDRDDAWELSPHCPVVLELADS